MSDKIKTSTLSLNNKRVYDFYTSNPHIGFEAMNIILLGFLEPLNNDISKLSNLTATGEILNCVKEIKQGMVSLGDTLIIKLHDHNKHFMETTKLVIGMASTENTDKIMTLLNRNTDAFIERLNSSIPKTHEETNARIQETLAAMHGSLQSDLKTFIASANKDTALKDFMTSLEQRLQQQQQPIYTHITAQLANIKEDALVSRTSSDKLFSDLGEFLGKYKSSSQFKGQCSENVLETVLNKLDPTADVINTTSLKASGDFIIKREDRPIIMVENKNYERNVNIEEVKKFLRDVSEQRCSGIMMSQFSGIASKPNGFIEIYDANVLIYLHNVNYSPEKIKMAIDIIDNLSVKLEAIASQEELSGIIIKKDVLDRINEQFQNFMNQKELLLCTMRETHKKLVTQIEDMKLPDLSLFLNDKYASIQNQQFLCDVCNLAFTTRRSLASHKKIHKTKPTSTIDPDIEHHADQDDN